MRNVSIATARTIADRVAAAFGVPAGDPYGPKAVVRWECFTDRPTTAVVWEEGPFEWAILATTGGITEWGYSVSPIALPKGVFAEPITTWAIGLYPA